jgi:hypothetical protein
MMVAMDLAHRESEQPSTGEFARRTRLTTRRCDLRRPRAVRTTDENPTDGCRRYRTTQIA